MKWILAAGLLVAAGAIAVAWWKGGEDAVIGEPFAIGDGRHHRVIRAAHRGAPLLVLLHERGGTPNELLWPELVDALEAEGENAPTVLLVDGGDHSYYHDRRDFDWGTAVLDAIDAVRLQLQTDPARMAIGGFSMGGFGALDLARQRRFCAVGAHSPALWDDGSETPEGAFDDAEDFERHDILEAARANPRLFRGAEVWLDVGLDDPFRQSTVQLGALVDAPAKTPPGDHSTGYWREHVDEYVQFYSRALKTCR